MRRVAPTRGKTMRGTRGREARGELGTTARGTRGTTTCVTLQHVAVTSRVIMGLPAFWWLAFHVCFGCVGFFFVCGKLVVLVFSY